MTQNDTITPPPPPSSPLRRVLADLHLSAVFLTRLPLPDAGIPAKGGLARAMRVFPLVGTVIGLISGLVFLAMHAVLPSLPAALLAVLAGLILTGALHEDGLADMADGLGARGGREARLAVMRDSRTGAYGVLALIFAIGLKVAALASAPHALAGLGALVAAHALSRGLIPAAMQFMPPARPDGLGAGTGMPDATVAATAGVLGLLVCVAGLGLGAPVAIIAALMVVAVLIWLARRTLGGHTGDVLGAIQQVSEIAILVVAAGIWS